MENRVENNKTNTVILHVCTICGKKFTNRTSIYSHCKSVHKLKLNTVKATLKCPLCEDTFRNCNELEHHLSTVHNISLDHKKLTFRSEDDFKVWKSNTEKETKSFYIYSRSITCGKTKIKYYQCHRSGVFKPQLKKGCARQRSMKQAGPNKIGRICPARIKASVNKKGYVEVDCILQHVGHDCELERLALTTSERESLAAKLVSGIPHHQILKDLSKTSDNNSRICLTTKKDLHNIKASFKIDVDVGLHQDDARSVDRLVEQYQYEEDNPILWYKSYGQDDTLVGKNNFILIFMNKPQRELLCKYGHDILIIDSTRGTDLYKVQLTALMVVDSDFQGFPVAFLWSATQTEIVFRKFFECLKKKVPELKPKTFMSDDATAFLKAFIKTYNYAPSHKLLCDWHVKRNLRENLNKINNMEKRNYVQKAVQKLINELDEQKFTIMLKKILKQLLNDADTLKYGQYFSTHYSKRPEQWARCFRKKLRLKTNHLERWHQDIQCNPEGKCQQRLDFSINNVLERLRLQFMRTLQSQYQNTVPLNLYEITKQHNLAEECRGHVEEHSNLWHVSSFTSNHQSNLLDFYQVSLNKDFINCSCRIRCDQCKICLHEYCCTCADYSVKYVICKHIHFVGIECMKLARKKSQYPIGNAEVEEPCSFQRNNVNSAEDTHSSEETIDLQEKIKKLIEEMTEIASSTRHVETLTCLSEMLSALKSNLQALECPSSDTNVIPFNLYQPTIKLLLNGS